jgi:hypothetical protein
MLTEKRREIKNAANGEIARYFGFISSNHGELELHFAWYGFPSCNVYR